MTTSYIIKIIKNLTEISAIHLRRLTLAAAICCIFMAMAHDPSKYAASSALADGKWGKVKVSQTGMQFVSSATLRKMGFNDPTKVNVYGFGGRILPDALRADDPDDLPILPSVKSAAGIWFFGHNHIRWSANSSGSMPYSHEMQPYAEESWYFLSDRAAEAPAPSDASLPTTAQQTLGTFTQMLLHEQDLMHPSESGRIYLGEDLRSSAARRVSFTLTDKGADEFRILVRAGSKTEYETTLTATFPGGDPVKVKLSKSTNEKGEFNNNIYLVQGEASGKGSTESEQLQIDLKYDFSGIVRYANLDNIELAYTRRIALNDGQIYFPLNLKESARIVISNAEAGMRVWDVTDHTRPLEVKYDLSGSDAQFTSPAGAREYLAFIPEKGGFAVADATEVGNQDLHALNTPDLLIISPREYLAAANTLAAHHREHDGFTVHVLQPEEIYNEFSSGTPDVGAFRRLLKMWYDRGQAPSDDNGQPRGRIGYCLIMSRPTYDNKILMPATQNSGYPRIPIWQSPSGSTYTSSYPCDAYIAMLDDYESTRSFNIGSQKMRVAVGRMPVKSLSEANAMVKKYIDYVTSPSTGTWRNRMMLIADDKDDSGFYHINQTEEMLAQMLLTEDANRLNIEKLYLDSYEKVMGQKGGTFPAAKERLLRLWNEGVNIMTYIGHASTVEWTHEKLLEWTDMQNFSNKNLPFLYAATCEFSRYDQDTPSGGEVLWSNPQGGIIATICPTRTVMISSNGDLSLQIGKSFFDMNRPGTGRRIGDIFTDAQNGVTGDNRLRFVIMGDPAMRLNIPRNNVQLTSIGGVDPESVEEASVLKARERVEIKGVVRNADGAVNTGFNGTVEVILYDAEKVMETYPYEDTGTTVFYNNHPTMLYRGLAKVSAGEWNTTLMIPLEIENLYTNARMTFYAYSDAGEEAHGYFSNFYVYGYDENATEDDKGPEIHYFGLNREDFESGGLVHTSPVAMAKISDESGINLSSLGIGHQITLTLDGRTYFDDVNTYYTPDPDDFTAGNILYPLPELEAGEHTLKLTVWDNANNSSSAEIQFNVAAAKVPEIYDLRTDTNPARESVNFTLSTDRPMAKVECSIEVFDLNGRCVWRSERTASTDMLASITIPWDLCTDAGVRVPRGIYLYRATVTSPDGTSATRSRKLAVTAQ